MSLDRARTAYAARSEEYIALFGDIAAAAEEDRARVLEWAAALDGPVVDVGCGPGHWTDFLCSHGVDVVGVDPVPEFIDRAQREYPDRRFRLGSASQLGVAGESLGGALSWFSLIHISPDELDPALEALARSIRRGGGFAIGFFEGPDLVPFDHAITTAYYWPADVLTARLERAGFKPASTHVRTDPGVRRQGMITARRE